MRCSRFIAGWFSAMMRTGRLFRPQHRPPWPAKIIAVDFDGTLCGDAFPGTGAPKAVIIRALQQLSASGWVVVIHTCRAARVFPWGAQESWPAAVAKLQPMFDFLEEQHVPFDSVWGLECIGDKWRAADYRWNPDHIGKPFAHVYLDNAACNPWDMAGLTERALVSVCEGAWAEIVERAKRGQGLPLTPAQK